jgi:hypothetical protein
MAPAATYSAIETLRDGHRVDIRAQRPDDRAELLAAIGRVSPQSLYRRFFAVKRGLTEQEVAYFLNIDFVDHVALVAVVEEAGRPVIVVGARYIVIEPGSAEPSPSSISIRGWGSVRPSGGISPGLPAAWGSVS